MSDVPFILTPEILPAIYDLRTKLTASKRFMAAWLAIAWFETLATMPSERIFWKSRWSLLKVFFLLNRWLSPVLQTVFAAFVFRTISFDTCARIFWIQSLCVTGVMFMSAVLMSIRVYALFATRKMLICLVVLVSLELGAMAGAASRFHPLLIPPTLGSLVSLSGCIAAGPGGRANAVVAVFWSSALAFDSVILGLTLYAILVVNRRAKHLPILTQIWRDGVLFYIVITAANLANVALYAHRDIATENFANPSSVALTSILATRLITSLRTAEAGQRRFSPGRSSTLKPWTPPVPPSPSFGSNQRLVQTASIVSKDHKFDYEERAAQMQGDNSVELSQLGTSIQFSLSSESRNRPIQALVTLARLGFIAPSTAVDISRPLPLAQSVPPPFADTIPLDPIPSNSPRSLAQTQHRSTGSGATAPPSTPTRTHYQAEGGAEPAGLHITVERETVVAFAPRL